MSEKPTILIFLDWFYPAYKAGGPIKSVFNIVNALYKKLNFFIVTSAYDLDESEILDGTHQNIWIKEEKYSIIYLNKKNQNKTRIQSIMSEVSPNRYYFNSIFSIKFTLLPLQLIKDNSKVILAPRGMLGAEALKIKFFKKKIFIEFCKLIGVFKHITWHASTKLEEEEIKKAFGSSSIIQIAQNIATLVVPRPKQTQNKRKGELKLIFFSRINEKKNLIFAIQVLKIINNTNVQLDIYGPIEDDNYFEKIIEIVNNNSLNVNYKGILKPTDLPTKLWNYHFLLFPTKHENYGHVIAESLCASLPVVISKNTPWLDLENKKVGYDLDLKDTDFVDIIKQLLNQNQTEYTILVESSYRFSQEKILNKKIIRINEQLFNNEKS